MGKVRGITGQRFGRLVAQYYKLVPNPKTGKNVTYWHCKCDCGNIAYVASTSLVNGNTMSYGCLKSKGEQKITQILQQNHIGFEREYIFSDFPNKRFDFYVPYCGLCIEYDGIQHFDKTNPYYSDNNIKRDREKDSYCNKNNIILVRIPYTDYHKISLKYILDRIEGE